MPALDPSSLFTWVFVMWTMAKSATRNLAGVMCFTMSHVDRYGIGQLMEMAIDVAAGTMLTHRFT